MTQTNIKLLNAFADHINVVTVITEREAYMRRFEPLRRIMLDGSSAHHDQNGSWFTDVDYEKLSIEDIVWISYEFDGVINMEDGGSEIEEAYEEDIWRDKMLKGIEIAVTQRTMRLLSAVRTDEEFF